MPITVSETSEALIVKLPYELRVSFKDTFKYAKWLPDEKAWKISLKSRKRLDQWVELATPAAKAIDEENEAYLSKQEASKIMAELAEIEAETKRKLEEIYQDKQSYNVLNCKLALTVARAELDTLKKEQAKLLEQNKQLLENYCDTSAILHAKDLLEHCKWNSITKSQLRRDDLLKFNQAVAVLNAQYSLLKNAGVHCAELFNLAKVTPTTLDQLKVKNITLESLIRSVQKVSADHAPDTSYEIL